MDFIKPFLKPEVIWFFVGVVLLVAEFALPGLIIGFFGVGACVVGVLCLIFDLSLNLQLLLFIVISVVLLVTLRKSVNRIFMGRSRPAESTDTDESEFIGERAVVVEAIAPNAPGKVELHGTQWTAVAEEAIAVGAAVKVIAKENITFKVKSL